MSDRLREALEWWFAPRPEPLSMSRREALLVDHLAHAARRFLALTETGQRVEWCETHNSNAPLPPMNRQCWVAGLSGVPGECSIVPKFLADYLTEEE